MEETLRHDYGPENLYDYFQECSSRLAEIQKSVATQKAAPDDSIIATLLNDLASLTGWICLIERSRLGEFSWPFARELRSMASLLLAESYADRDRVPPITHIISEGQQYKIVFEPMVRAASADRKFIVVAFPRSLKHHVLLHALFGHELGHTALNTTGSGPHLQNRALVPLTRSGVLMNEASITAWINDSAAPEEMKNALDKYRRLHGEDYSLKEYWLRKWQIELTCDLFGLLLFGPSFLAAHRTYLHPFHPRPHAVEDTAETHPPYAMRYKLLRRAMMRCGWQTPITIQADGPIHAAERQFLNAILDDPFHKWADVFDDRQIDEAIAGVHGVLTMCGTPMYDTPARTRLVHLVGRLTRRIPPIMAEISASGTPQLEKAPVSQILYAGWVYWEGRRQLEQAERGLSFNEVNQLCDLALLQQRAIDLTIG